MPKGYFKPLTIEDEQYIFENYLKLPIKRVAKKIGITGGRVMRFLKKHNLIVPKEVIERNKNSSYYKKGRIPENKGKKQTEYMSAAAIEKTKSTRFKKGSKPHNTKFDGYESFTKDGYIQIRISEGVFKLKHTHEWEKKYGKIPEGHCLRNVDGNKKNTNPDNWKLITKAENMYNNSKMNYPKEIIPSLVLVNKLSRQINTLENGKE